MSPRLTPTQDRLYRLLSDGYPHSREELLREALDDDLATAANLAPHISNLRKKIRSSGLGIFLQLISGRIHYCMVRFLHSPVKD